jgi:hypothetical protein
MSNFNVNKHIRLSNSEIAHKTPQNTWAEVFKHGLPVNPAPAPAPAPKPKIFLSNQKKRIKVPECEECHWVYQLKYIEHPSKLINGKNLCNICQELCICICCGKFSEKQLNQQPNYSNPTKPYVMMCDECVTNECCRSCGDFYGGSLCKACRRYHC